MNESNNELQNEDLEFYYGGENIKISCHAEVPKREKINLKQIIPQLTKSKGGLYPHEIVMLNEVSRYKTNTENRFSWYWENDLGVENPQALIDKLVSQGFADVEDTKTTISRLTIPEIKEFLKEYGCKLTGNKPELLERLFAECDITAIDRTLTQRRYCLTDKGKEEVEREENEYIMFTFRKGNGISIFEMNIMLYNNNPLNLTYKDIIWEKYVKEAEEDLKNFNFGGYRGCAWAMSRFLRDENRYDESLYYLCEVAAYDLSGLAWYSISSEDTLKNLEWKIQHYFPYKSQLFHYNDFSLITIAPALVDDIRSMQIDMESKGLNFKEKVIKNLKEIKLFKEVFSTEEKIEIFFAELDEDYDKLEEIYSKLEKIIKDKYNKLMEETIKYFVEYEEYDNDTKKLQMFDNGIFLKRKLEEYDEEEYDEASIKMLAENLLFTDEETAEEDIERITELLKSIMFTDEDEEYDDEGEEYDDEGEEYDDEGEEYDDEDKEYDDEDKEYDDEDKEYDDEDKEYDDEDEEYDDEDDEYDNMEKICELFTSFDKERIIKYYKQNEIQIPEDEELFWVVVHKMICKLFSYEDSTIETKQFNESFNWLISHGYSILEDADDDDEIE